MKPLAHRSPSNKGAFCWARIPAKDGGCTWRLFRRDGRGVVHFVNLAYSSRLCRKSVADTLRREKRALRDLVDEIDLTLMEAA